MGAERWAAAVLGPLQVRDPSGADRTPDGVLQRRLLALLVLRRGHTVPMDAVVDALWPSDPPRDPVAAVQNHVSRLRRLLPPGAVSLTAAGYRLDPALIVVDADRLPDVLDALSSAEAGDAVRDAEDVLRRWHGPAYPELADVEDGRAEAVRLEELRARLREERAARALADGEHDGVIAQLVQLAEDEPLRERPRALLMEALVAAGRRVDALRAYDDFRRRLADELGIDPSPALAAQHAELLAGTDRRPVTEAIAPTGRVPAPPTPLVGRDALVEQVLDAAAGHRVVTLVGPGGVGKTRLLLEAGRLLQERDPETPVVLCELAPSDDATAAAAVATALGIDARPGVAPAERIASVVGEQPVVVLLDNCEHVLAPVAALVEIVLARCPAVRVIATSRERLRVHGEVLRRVPTLDVEGEHPTAVQLFLDRAAASSDSLTGERRELELVDEIVRRLDGLPLAIELAAARLHTHDLEEIVRGLDARFSLLSSGYRPSDRHGSLEAAVSWSFDLLDPWLQEVLADLSAFSGAFTVEDAAAITGLDRARTDEALAQLAERSLVMRAPDRRHVLLETLRAFGAERLAASGRAAEVGRRHAHHQVGWIVHASSHLGTVGAGPTLADIDAALPELRAGLLWLLGDGDVERAGALISALSDYGFFRLRPDVLAWADAVAAADPNDTSPYAPVVSATAAYAAWMSGDLAGHDARVARALRAAGGSEEGVPSGVHPEVPTVRGNCALFAGRLDEAARWYHRAVELAAEGPRRVFARATELLALGYAGDPQAADLAADLLGVAGDDPTPDAAYGWYCAGEAVAGVDRALAVQRHERALELARRAGASAIIGLAGASKASIEARHGDPEIAASSYRELIWHWRRAGMWATQWTMLRSIAALLARRGQLVEAAQLEGAVRATRAGHEIFGADALALAELGNLLIAALGPEAYARARAEGAELDGEAAVELALRAL